MAADEERVGRRDVGTQMVPLTRRHKTTEHGEPPGVTGEAGNVVQIHSFIPFIKSSLSFFARSVFCSLSVLHFFSYFILRFFSLLLRFFIVAILFIESVTFFLSHSRFDVVVSGVPYLKALCLRFLFLRSICSSFGFRRNAAE